MTNIKPILYPFLAVSLSMILSPACYRSSHDDPYYSNDDDTMDTSTVEADTATAPETDTSTIPDDDKECGSFFEEIREAYSALKDQHINCEADAECVMFDYSVECYTTCPIAINTSHTGEFSAALVDITERFCSDLLEDCWWKYPCGDCAPREGYCDDSKCRVRCPHRLAPAGDTIDRDIATRSDGTCGAEQCFDLVKENHASYNYLEHCCTKERKCGVGYEQVFGDSCFKMRQPGRSDDQCQPIEFWVDDGACGQDLVHVDLFQGCCRPDGLCGVFQPVEGAVNPASGSNTGCIERQLFAESLKKGCGGYNQNVKVESVACDY